MSAFLNLEQQAGHQLTASQHRQHEGEGWGSAVERQDQEDHRTHAHPDILRRRGDDRGDQPGGRGQRAAAKDTFQMGFEDEDERSQERCNGVIRYRALVLIFSAVTALARKAFALESDSLDALLRQKAELDMKIRSKLEQVLLLAPYEM